MIPLIAAYSAIVAAIAGMSLIPISHMVYTHDVAWAPGP